MIVRFLLVIRRTRGCAAVARWQRGGAGVLAALRKPMLRVVELQASLSKRVVHRPERPGYRPNLKEEVREALLQV